MTLKPFHFSKNFNLLIIVLGLSITSCRTNEVVTPSPKPQTEAFIKFLSISLNVDKDKIKYDSKTNSFLLLNKVKYDWGDVEQLYNKSNEYHLKYESK